MRNRWTYDETQVFVTLIKELESIKKMEQKLAQPNEIYKELQKEMIARGFFDKSITQIKFRWQNLRKLYYRDRRAMENAKSKGTRHNKSPYFRLLHPILADRWERRKREPGEPLMNDLGEDSTILETPITYEESLQNSSEEDNEEVQVRTKAEKEDVSEMPAFEECFPNLPSSSKQHVGTPDSTTKLDLLQAKIKQVAKELNDDLYKKQKELIEYEFRLFAEYTTSRDEKFKEMMATNTQTFLGGIKDLMTEKNEMKTRSKSDRNSKQFFQTRDHDSDR